MTQKSLYIFGDSVCFGQYVSIHKTWVALLSKSLDQDDTCSEVLTQVTAINGETSSQALARLEYCVLNHKPTVVWVQYGLNDANYWQSDLDKPRVDKEIYAANMLSIAKQCLASGTSFVLIPTNHPVTREIPHLATGAYFLNVRKYNETLREAVCDLDDPRIKIVDMDRNFPTDSFSQSKLLIDGVHLNEQGHELYFRSSVKLIKSYFLKYRY